MQSLQVAFVVVLGVIYATAHLTQEQHDQAKTISESCHEELGGELPDDYATRMSRERLILTSETAKCHVHCLYTKIGVVYEDGTVNRMGLIEQLRQGNPIEKAERFATLCEKIEGATKCERAYNLYQCYYNHKSSLVE
uniref:Uncharacterized protein n=1 Tax=Anopheles atroparvus TaxID=41427 RepID=A0A182IME5_ANOAO